MLNISILPPQIQAILPMLQNLDDKQRFSLIRLLENQKTAKTTVQNTENDWHTFQQERNNLLKNENFSQFLVDRNQSLPQTRNLFDDME